MTDTTTATVQAPAHKNFVERVFGVFFSPRATFADIAARPRALGVLLLVVVIAGGTSAIFFSTDVGKQAWLDAGVRQQEAFGRTISDAQYAQMERMSQYAAYFGIAPVFVLPMIALVVSGLFLGVFNAALGGDATFKQVFAVVAHSAVILTFTSLIVLPLAYVRESLTSSTNLAVFFPFLDENSFAAHFLGSIDLVYVWWMVTVSIGLGVLYKRRTGPISTTLLIVYAVIALVIAAIRSAVSGA